MNLVKLLHSKALGLGFLSWTPALMALCLYIVTVQPNLLSRENYYIGIFFTVTVLCILNTRNKIALVPAVEYILVFGVLYGKDINDPVNTILLVYPLIEGVVFRGRFQNTEILILSCIIVTGSLTYPHPQIGLFLAEAFLFAANIFCREESKIVEQEANIFMIVDRYYRSRNVTRKTHEVYHKIIYGWNVSSPGIELSGISTYFLKNGNFYLINSSDYKWDRKLDINEETRTKLLNDDSAIWETTYPGVADFKRYLVPVNMDERLYLVEYNVYKRSPVSLFAKRGAEKVFKGLAGRIVNLVEFAHRLKERDAVYFKETTEKREYMEKAVGTMHFIRNRLNSIASLVEYGKMPEKEKSALPPDMVKRLFKSAEQDYMKISRYADEMLDSRKFPYAYTEQKELKQETAFIELAETVESQLQRYVTVISDATINPGNGNISQPAKPKRPLWVNETDLRVMMTDWISNMRKYGGDFEVEWKEKEKYVEITFRNTSEAESAANVLNAMEVISPKTWDTRKKTYGILKMRELAAKNNILLDVSVSDLHGDNSHTGKKSLAITIQIPLKHEQEDSGDRR